MIIPFIAVLFAVGYITSWCNSNQQDINTEMQINANQYLLLTAIGTVSVSPTHPLFTDTLTVSGGSV